jgi:hypothetical protein
MLRCKQCILDNKSNRKAVGSVIQHDGPWVSWAAAAQIFCVRFHLGPAARRYYCTLWYKTKFHGAGVWCKPRTRWQPTKFGRLTHKTGPKRCFKLSVPHKSTDCNVRELKELLSQIDCYNMRWTVHCFIIMALMSLPWVWYIADWGYCTVIVSRLRYKCKVFCICLFLFWIIFLRWQAIVAI